jgi:hypothetical protein
MYLHLYIFIYHRKICTYIKNNVYFNIIPDFVLVLRLEAQLRYLAVNLFDDLKDETIIPYQEIHTTDLGDYFCTENNENKSESDTLLEKCKHLKSLQIELVAANTSYKVCIYVNMDIHINVHKCIYLCMYIYT